MQADKCPPANLSILQVHPTARMPMYEQAVPGFPASPRKAHVDPVLLDNVEPDATANHLAHTGGKHGTPPTQPRGTGSRGCT